MYYILEIPELIEVIFVYSSSNSIISFIFGYKFWKSDNIFFPICKHLLISIISKLKANPEIFKNVFGLMCLELLIVSLFKLENLAKSTSRFLLLNICDPLFSKLSQCKL